MRVFAYCCESFAESARRASGVEPITCPPVNAGNFCLEWLEGQDLIYFDLHGEPGAPIWLGDDRIIALMTSQVRQADLRGAIVFAVNCYLADEGAPMMAALLDAGARYVVGGEGKNWANTKRPTGAAALGQRFRQLLERGIEPMMALALAKRWLALGSAFRQVLGRRKSGKVMAVKDTLAFRAYCRRGA